MKSLVYNIRSEKSYLYVREFGKSTDPLLVMLHGNGEEGSIFQNQINYFQRTHHLVLIDTRGHGKSDFGEEKLSFSILAKDIVNILDFFNEKKANILGFSDGANIAMYMANFYPEYVNKLILVGGNSKPEGMKKNILTSTKLLYLFQEGLGFFSVKMKKKADVTDLMLDELNWGSHMKKSDKEALIVRGEHDVITMKHTLQIKELFTNSYLRVMDNATHFLMIEKPNKFNKWVDDFLTK